MPRPDKLGTRGGRVGRGAHRSRSAMASNTPNSEGGRRWKRYFCSFSTGAAERGAAVPVRLAVIGCGRVHPRGGDRFPRINIPPQLHDLIFIFPLTPSVRAQLGRMDLSIVVTICRRRGSSARYSNRNPLALSSTDRPVRTLWKRPARSIVGRRFAVGVVLIVVHETAERNWDGPITETVASTGGPDEAVVAFVSVGPSTRGRSTVPGVIRRGGPRTRLR